LSHPLGIQALNTELKRSDRILILSDDNTRMTPAKAIIPALLSLLNAAGIPDERISCILALGTHRYMTPQEIEDKVGREVCRRIRVFNHDWRNPEVLVNLGYSRRGTPILVNRAALEADLLVGIGAVVPHHIPGFSGSSKIVQPGICGEKTTAETHFLACSGGGDSFLGLEDNPVRRDMEDMADRVNLRYVFNVVLNSDGGVVGAFFGERQAAFKKAVSLAKDIYGVDYHEAPDIVIANSYPCDLDFWQSHKSMYPAQRMIKEKGTMIICTPAPEGVSPVHTDLLHFANWTSTEIKAAYRRGDLTNGVATALATAWAIVREKANIITFSPGISREDKNKLGHAHAPSIAWALSEALRLQGPDARITVLTHAPDTLPLKAF
jgi:nickel-dependent lactate racemase